MLDYTSTRQTNSLNSDKKVNSKPSETGRSPLNRLANRPIILRSSAYFEFYIFRVFSLRFVSGGVFHAPSFFYAPKLLFQSFSSWTLLPENVKKNTQNLFQPIHAFSLSRQKTVCQLLRIKRYEHTHTNPEKDKTTARQQSKNIDKT